jgi:hypothetical protein
MTSCNIPYLVTTKYHNPASTQIDKSRGTQGLDKLSVAHRRFVLGITPR